MNDTIHLNTANKFSLYESASIKKIILLLIGVLLLTITSQISIPLKPIPLTFQSTTVILIGMTFGARYGIYVITLYLMAGIFGFPVFEGFTSGLYKFLGPTPTGGYLIGFLPAVALSGYLAEKGFAKNMLTSFIAGIASDAIIFLFGILFLAKHIGFYAAITFGLLPFIVSEVIKLMAVAVIIPTCWKNYDFKH